MLYLVEWLDRLLKEEQMKRVIEATEREDKLSESWAEDGEEGLSWEEWEAERKAGEDFTQSSLSRNLWEALTKSELEGRSLPLDDLDCSTPDDQLYDTKVPIINVSPKLKHEFEKPSPRVQC
jgi:hypothetical protein